MQVVFEHMLLNKLSMMQCWNRVYNPVIHNNLSIAASTYTRRGDFVFRGLDFSEILSIFIKPSRKANILKEVLLWKSKSHCRGWLPKKPKDSSSIWTQSLCSSKCTPENRAKCTPYRFLYQKLRYNSTLRADLRLGAEKPETAMASGFFLCPLLVRGL